MFDAKVGDTIEILNMQGEPEYMGKTGVVELIDDIGQLHGTWGGLAVTEGDTIRVIEDKKQKKFIVRECTCPVCGSHKVDYGDSELNDDIMSYYCDCRNCGTYWKEDFALTFCGLSGIYDSEHNCLGNVINLEGEEECPDD